MLGNGDIRILLLILSLLTNIKSTKVLSDQKKCADPECETSMSRALAIKDYSGPDCRYLDFKTGEEITIYFKLSRKREDLWAGSETDFLCLDGKDYVFENEGSILNHDEGNEYLHLHTDVFPKEYKKPFPDSEEFDSKSEELYILESTSHDDSELRDSKIGQDETIQQEDQNSQTLGHTPSQSSWTISSFTNWFSLERKKNEEAAGKTADTAKEVTFRHRKTTIMDDSDLKTLNEEGDIEPRTSSWFKSTFTDLLHYGGEKSGLGLLYKENDPEILDSSTTAGTVEHDTTAVSEEVHRNSRQSESNWFDKEISDVLTFGYFKGNKVKEKPTGGEESDQNEESPPPSTQTSLIHEDLRKQAVEMINSEEQEKYDETVKQITESTLQKEKEKYDQEAPERYINKANKHIDLDAADPSFSIEVLDKMVKYAEQDSESRNQVMENINIKAVMKESDRTNDQSGIMNKEQLPGNAPKESNYLNSDKEPNNSQHSETNNIPPVNNEEKMHTSIKNDGFHPDFKGKLPKNLRMTQNTFINNEREWLFQIILLLNDFCAIITSGLSIMTTASKKVLGALPENMRPGPDLYGFPWEIAICGAVLAIFVILLLMCRSYQSVTSRLYVGREKQLASKVAELIEDKCKILEKLSLRKKEYEELENSLKDASLLQGSTTTSDLKKAYEELSSTNSVLKNEIALLEKELREEKSKGSELDDLMVEIQRRVEYSENEAKSIQSQIAEAKTTLKVYEINRERLKISLQDALEENSHLQESEKQLLQEAEGWHERLSELNEQTKMFQCSKADMEEALKNKESQVKSLTECLLEMKDWSSAIGEHDAVEDSHWENDIKCERENGEHLDDQEKRTIKKLIYAAKLNACLKSMETERNQIYSKLTDEKKAKEELAERIECLQKEHGVLQSENTHFENEVQKLQQKVKVMSELYQENEMNLHRKLTVEEKERLQKEEKLSKVDEKIIHAAEELNIYRQQAKDLEEELERTVRSYQNQIMSHEKKAHDNWLTARAAERHLNDLRKENLHNRQKLTEAEFKCDLLEKDPYALDVPVRPFGREHSPYGPSPMGRPSSETRAFLSPPILLEGPLRLSPVLPGGGGGRGSRGPGNPGTYDIGNERGEMNSDRLSDPHRPPSDTGSLSPPWDRDHRINPSHTGQLYNEQSLTPRRPERFYSNHPNSGRLSGPAELRSYNMQSFDKADGRQAAENNSRMDMSGNGIKDHLNDSNAVNFTDQSLAPENETLGPGIVPPPLPLLRPPLIPMDPRGAFIRRGPPFPPMPPSAAYGPREYFPRDFAGLPRPLLPMRGPFPVRPFSQYPPPRAGFFPPMPPDNRNELPAESTHLSAASSTDHQDSQQET
ncbi:melanoma inhibitory activity protein 2 isoform X5 [Sceloporus undulatus]|uniref:melanoma inhibitory activity protein 2 isoform X5 n=1 Tax=Sceloporus undulatus TaxID=8520 RepID=UPI001C4D1326|nr:melanoma inhibitory activity protein 2 isoform X5 [Sceloporus undulatus]